MSDIRTIAVLLGATWAFVVCLAVWMMFGVTGIPIRELLGLQRMQPVASTERQTHDHQPIGGGE